MNNYQKLLITICLIFISITFTFKDVTSGSNVFATPDSQSAAAVGKGMELYKKENGAYPNWNPWIFSGVPATHSLQHVSRFYPPNIILKQLNNIGMPNFFNYILHFVFMGLGCFLILYRKNLNIFACFYAGLSFTIMPYLITMIVHGHGSQMMTSAYIPWVFLYLEKLREKSNLKNLSILALLIGFQLLRGHVQIAYYTWLIVGLYGLIHLINDLKENNIYNYKKFYLYTFLGLITGFITSLQLYYPAYSYSPFSIRGGTDGGTGFDYATAWSFSFGEMFTFLNPNYYGFGGATYWGNMPFTDYPNYMSIISIILIFFSFFIFKNIIIKILSITSIIALLLSFGNNSFIYELFYNYFPFFNKFRVPAMFLILLQFCTVILSGYGLNYLITNQEKKRILFYPIISTIGLLILSNGLSNYLLINSKKSHNILDPYRIEMISDGFSFGLILLFICGIIIFLFTKKIITKEIVGISFISLMALDLYNVNEKIITPNDKFNKKTLTMKSKDFKKLYKDDEVIQFLKKDKSNYRILPLPPLLNDNRWSAFHLENVGGYHPAKLQNYQTLMTDVGFNSPGYLQMLNVKYLISLSELNHPLFELTFNGKLNHQGNNVQAFVYLNKLNHDNVIIPKDLKIYKNSIELNTALKDPYFSPFSTSLINKDSNLKEGINGSGRVLEFSKSPDKIRSRILMDKAGLVVFSEIYYPNGWDCYVNNSLNDIHEINGLLRGVYLEEGENNLEMVFQPTDLKYSKIISNFGFLLIFFGLIVRFYKERIK